MGLFQFLESSPYLEVLVRRIYWNTPWLVDYVSKKKIRKIPSSTIATAETFSRIEAFLKEQGVTPGRIMVVHSSAEALKPTGYSPAQIIDRLIALGGPEATLAMPAIPRYKETGQGAERITKDVSDTVCVYDVKKTLPWTGVLPLKLMQRPGSIRSRHPLNSMVAIGPLAEAMMKDNLVGDKPLACGPNSSWKFCADRKAVIVALGVDMAHSLTMIHVAEDSYEAEWPVDGWYRDRKFVVVSNGEQEEVVVRERHPKWATYFAERTLSRDLKRAGLLVSTEIDGILVEVIESAALMEFLNQRKPSAYPYFLIPRSSRKK
jgi:aminoglycoside 3-N-acetyltransferase